jgi:preprotein translocase subunit YajC
MNLHPLLLTLADAVAQAPTTPGGAPQPSLLNSPLIPFASIAIIFYFLIIRPQQKRQKEQAALIASVKAGDSVVTTSGIHGLVASVRDNTILVKVADNVKIEFDKAAVATVTKKATEA